MKFAYADLKKLRWHLAGAASLIMGAGAIVHLGLVASRGAEAEHKEAAVRRGQIESKLRQVRTEEEEIKDRAALFLRLQENGVLGEERRLEWTEMLRDIQLRMRLPGISYEISPQKALADEKGGSGHAFYVSSMKLHLQLLHEEDLLNFLERLRREARAMVLARSCNVARPAAGESGTPQAQLHADCELDWVTLSIQPP